MNEIILQTINLFYQYPTRSDFALSDINITIERGEFVALIGQNGSGKTTLVKHFNGLLKPTRGQMIVQGSDTANLKTSELAKFVGYVFQNPDHQIFADKVRDEIAFGPKNLGFSAERIAEETTRVLKDVGLSGFEDTMPFQLSRGQRQRLAVASILAMDPSILIIDEPTTGQDWKESISIMELVKQLNNQGHTCVVITHNMNLVSLYARRVIVLSQGGVLLDGPTQQVFREVDTLIKASIKPPEVYELAEAMLPGLPLDKPITPKDLVDLLAEHVLERPRQAGDQERLQ